MIILTMTALSVSTLMRSQELEREAKASHSYVMTKIGKAKGVSQQIREKTERIKTDPGAAASMAQNNLRLVRHNEVVVIVP
jgi:hypothetical protein